MKSRNSGLPDPPTLTNITQREGWRGGWLVKGWGDGWMRGWLAGEGMEGWRRAVGCVEVGEQRAEVSQRDQGEQ